MLALEKCLIPGTIVVRGDRKSCPKIHCKTMHDIFSAFSKKERLNFLPIESLHTAHFHEHIFPVCMHTYCKSTISGIVGRFQSVGAFIGQRALSFKSSPISGCVHGHEPPENGSMTL